MKKEFSEKDLKIRRVDLPKEDDELLQRLSKTKDAINHEDQNDEEELIQDLEGQRKFQKHSWQNYLIVAIAFCWSLYQLYVVVVPTNSVFIRSVHLSFAVALGFLVFPMRKSINLKSKIPIYDFILLIIGVITALYIYIEYYNLADRPGAYLLRDIVFAFVAIVILLEGARRALGLALPIIVLIFLAYDYFGPYMPDLIAHKGASISKMAGQMYLTTEGIFGVPLGVSADFVFLFVLFGALLERAGAGEYFINLAYALLGKYRGGPAKASVAASGLTGIVSGSSIANTVTTGTFTIPLMKKLGFPAHKAGAVEVASSTNGQLMPPIMGAAAFIIAEFLGISYSEVVMAAFVPAFVAYFSLFYIVHLESLKLGLRGANKDELPNKLKTFISGLHYLLPIFFLIYTLIILRQSAMAAAFNAIMVTLAIMVVQKPFYYFIIKKENFDILFLIKLIFSGFSDIGHGLINGAKNMIPIALATSLAGMVVGSVTMTGIGQVLIEVIENLSGGYIVAVLLLTAITSLILGMGLPTTANYIVMASLTAPVILTLSADNGYLIPSIAAHLFVFYFGILADVTPPVGIAAYAASGIAKSDPIRTGIQGFIYDIRTGILPFMFFFNSKLLLIRSINPDDPGDATSWVWINNPFEILMIFTTAVIGMFAFASATQGYVIKKINTLERILLIAIIPFMFLPELSAKYLGYNLYFLSYFIGISLFALVYFLQKKRK